MPKVEIPLQSYTTLIALRKSRKKLDRFEQLGDEGLALAAIEKLVKARRQEISLELYDLLDGTLPENVKSVGFDQRSLGREDLVDTITNLISEDVLIESATLTSKKGGPTKKLDKARLFAYPIKCANPKCKTVNHLPADAYEACQKPGEDRRPGVSFKLAGESEDE